MLRTGPDAGPTILVALPPFEEANRTRTLMVGVMRALATHGFGAALPDLPGQSESLLPTAAATLPAWRAAFAAACAALPGPVHVVAVRAGALVDADADARSRWYWAPQDGVSLVRELRRMTSDAGHVAGNVVAPALLDALAAAAPTSAGPLRVVRLADDSRPADRHVLAPPPWRASEPRHDPVLCQTLASDIVEWIATCGN